MRGPMNVKKTYILGIYFEIILIVSGKF